ncbi:type II toxin-antitoxin system antitoxin SocA domain-containing protein [Mammaliicoccus sp. I-M35]|uniref:Panacea domain-containing protein n=1 Tax=Mammaliicoccus sp. I-M35 TaxID=2898694 RepID=UPI0031F331B8
MKLQKLIYFAQRESLALTGEVLFNDRIEGWKFGPVIPKLRYYLDEMYEPSDTDKLNDTEKYVINNVISQYGMYSGWYLRELSHHEKCWKKSRINLNNNEVGNREITPEDIIEDAKSVRLYDHVYDMYIDEFEDLNEEEVHLGFS